MTLWWILPYTDMNQPQVYMVPYPERSSHLPPHPIPLGCPSTQALSALFHASDLHWSSVSHMVIYRFQCNSLKSSHLHLLPQSPKVCSLYLCLSYCLTYRVIITIFLNSTYMRSVQFSSVQSLSCVQLFVTPRITAHRPPCPSPSPGVHSNSCPSSR